MLIQCASCSAEATANNVRLETADVLSCGVCGHHFFTLSARITSRMKKLTPDPSSSDDGDDQGDPSAA